MAFQVVTKETRETIARLRNCILALAQCKMMIYDTCIMYAYEESFKKYRVDELLLPEAMLDIGVLTQQHINMLQNL